MKIWRSEAEFDLESCVAALGMFDGVHIGHQALIRSAMELARQLDTSCVVYTFDRHPMSVFCPEREPKQLMTLQEKLDKLSALGVDGVLVQPFTAQYAATEPAAFLEGLVSRLRVKGIVAGFNYSFGAGGRGDAAMIRTQAERLGYAARIVEAVSEDGETVSSTLIRSLLEEGEHGRARRLLRLGRER